ncbi:MAG: hypothetical protein PVG41_00080, partial [Desulfobacteraceae bacterium]
MPEAVVQTCFLWSSPTESTTASEAIGSRSIVMLHAVRISLNRRAPLCHPPNPATRMPAPMAAPNQKIAFTV